MMRSAFRAARITVGRPVARPVLSKTARRSAFAASVPAAAGVLASSSLVHAEAKSDAKAGAKAESAGKDASKQPQHFYRVVLTGGPCGGKSSSLADLSNWAKQKGFDVYAIPE